MPANDPNESLWVRICRTTDVGNSGGYLLQISMIRRKYMRPCQTTDGSLLLLCPRPHGIFSKLLEVPHVRAQLNQHISGTQ